MINTTESHQSETNITDNFTQTNINAEKK